MCIFDVPISVYNGVTDRVGTTTLLRCFLWSKKHIRRIIALRNEPDAVRRKAIKLSLPMATVSGVFSPTRKVENLRSHSGFLCIDIDGKDNPNFSIDDIGVILREQPCVAYAAQSVSGNGMFAILPLAYPAKQSDQFAQLKHEFSQRYGLVLDDCGDTTRLRALSYDSNPYVNEQAAPYEGIEVINLRKLSESLTGEIGDLRKVSRCVEIIDQNHIDITGSYEEWFNIGASLASLGENGRYFFHVVSRQYPGYKYAETEKKFTQLLRSAHRIGLGTFFYWCSQYGINYRRERPL